MRMRGGADAAHRRAGPGGGTRRAVIAAIAIAAAGVLLIGGVPAYAYFTASSSGAVTTIASGNLTMSVTGPVNGTAAPASPYAGTDVVARSGSQGMVPGVQAQTLTYTVTNTSTARAPARLTVSVSSTGVPTAQWMASVGALSATVQVGTGTTPTALTISSVGVAGTGAVTPVLQPGASTTVVVTFSLARMNGSVDMARTLTSSSSTSVLSWLTLQPTMTLQQVPITVTS
jgi:predicted ribosomally synthesized peptide with SipW-like signal peptide